MTAVCLFLALSVAAAPSPQASPVGVSSSTAKLLADRFSESPSRSAIASRRLQSLQFNDEVALAAWHAYLDAPSPSMRSDFDSHLVKTSDRTSPYLWRTVGQKPKAGWGLVIAMHGGGSGPASMNDGEWHYMFDHYYLDHPEAGGYVYLALRAPNDNWNGFYDDAISPLVERLITQFVKFGGVDPGRVYACGASHGGYGAFVLGPKIPYRFAAVHPAAAAGTDGETQGENLRNLRFTWSVGEHDTDYGRVDRARIFAKNWATWQAQYGGFDGALEVVSGAGHLINSHEANELPELLKYRRNASPKRVVWVQSDNVLHRFYWLEAMKPVNQGRIDAEILENTITLKTLNQGPVALWLNSQLVDFKKPITVLRDGKRSVYTPRPSLGTFCDGIADTHDPDLSGPVRLVINP